MPFGLLVIICLFEDADLHLANAAFRYESTCLVSIGNELSL